MTASARNAQSAAIWIPRPLPALATGVARGASEYGRAIPGELACTIGRRSPRRKRPEYNGNSGLSRRLVIRRTGVPKLLQLATRSQRVSPSRVWPVHRTVVDLAGTTIPHQEPSPPIEPS